MPENAVDSWLLYKVRTKEILLVEAQWKSDLISWKSLLSFIALQSCFKLVQANIIFVLHLRFHNFCWMSSNLQKLSIEHPPDLFAGSLNSKKKMKFNIGCRRYPKMTPFLKGRYLFPPASLVVIHSSSYIYPSSKQMKEQLMPNDAKFGCQRQRLTTWFNTESAQVLFTSNGDFLFTTEACSPKMTD